MDEFVKGIAFVINWVVDNGKGVVDNFPVEVSFTGKRIRIGDHEFGCFERTDTKKPYYLTKAKVNSMLPEELESVDKW